MAEALGRPGLAARAVVYLVLAVLTFDIAFDRSSPTRATGGGALADVVRQPGGRALLTLLSLGLLCYASWRVMQAVGRDASGGTSGWKRLGWAAIALVYVGLLYQAVHILLGRPGSGGPSNHPVSAAARVLAWSGGPLWLGLAGAAMVVGGAVLGVWGVARDHREELTAHRPDRRVASGARLLGAFGNVTRGALVVAIGIYLLLAATTDDPLHVRSLDTVLLTTAHQPAGPVWLGLAATGLVAYAAFSAVEARHRRL